MTHDAFREVICGGRRVVGRCNIPLADPVGESREEKDGVRRSLRRYKKDQGLGTL